jgi:uncharacterized protein YgiM (DUF1202 family)
MAARVIVLAAAFSLATAAGLLGQVAAEPAVAPQVQNSKYQFAGQINADRVMIRSGPSENYYGVAQLNKGVQVTVVGIKGDWLKIAPPEGCFSVIAKAFVNKDADGGGTVLGDKVRVRCGSSMVALKTTVQCWLSKGEKVAILGEQDEYYQIKPPADAYVYVHQKFVEPLKQLNVTPILTQKADGAQGVVEPTTRPADGGTAQIDTTLVPAGRSTDETATAKKAAERAARAEAEFDRLEALRKGSLDKNLAEQPVEELVSGYEALVKDEYLSVPMRRISEVWLIGLRSKAAAKAELLATRKEQAEAMERIAALRAEREAVEQKRAEGLVVYTALGTLKASTLQVGDGTLYRVTDPATDRTLCYVRNNEAGFVKFLDKFVGVKGEAVSDPQLTLKVISTAEAEVVDMDKVNKGVTALYLPPSLLSRPAGATTQQN